MVKRFILKRINRTPFKINEVGNNIVIDEIKDKPKNGNNKTEKKDDDMVTMEQINKAQEIASMINDENVVIKRVKKDKGLMEKTNSEKVVIVEDNRQILNG